MARVKNIDSIPDNFVLISLYVDDRQELKKEHQFNVKMSENHIKAIKTIGDKWATFQYLNFKTASQPYYVTLNTDLEILNECKQYAGIYEYQSWLKKNLDTFRK